ncbi:MAG TPA: tRNA glutamyl-Q(34) synthetase GluQRS [Polyangiales bacterium]|jgi:glutamyl-tRNA synthetase
MSYRGRLAPSPTGALHLGIARTALVAWLRARAASGKLIMRIEDIDLPRVVPGSAQTMLADLRWLGLDWDEGPDVGGPHAPYVQSRRSALYAEAIARLCAGGFVYPCSCSRKEIAEVASAPHGDLGPIYPGTCRPPAKAAGGRPAAGASGSTRRPSLRFAMPSPPELVRDVLAGEYDVGVSDDFVLQRGDGVYAYQLAVVVDDIAMGVSEVVRGDDLLSSTPRQIALYRALGAEPPKFLHVPLLLGPDGRRLSKRQGAKSIAEYRAEGMSAEQLIGLIAATLGLAPPGQQLTAAELSSRFELRAITRDAFRLPG